MSKYIIKSNDGCVLSYEKIGMNGTLKREAGFTEKVIGAAAVRVIDNGNGLKVDFGQVKLSLDYAEAEELMITLLCELLTDQNKYELTIEEARPPIIEISNGKG